MKTRANYKELHDSCMKWFLACKTRPESIPANFLHFAALGPLRCAKGFHSEDRHSDGGGLCHGISSCIKVFLDSHDLWLCTKEVLVQETKDASEIAFSCVRVVCRTFFDILAFSLNRASFCRRPVSSHEEDFNLPGKSKWQGGMLAKDGAIYVTWEILNPQHSL